MYLQVSDNSHFMMPTAAEVLILAATSSQDTSKMVETGSALLLRSWKPQRDTQQCHSYKVATSGTHG